MKDMILIMIDECGDEFEVNRYRIGNELDDDYLELWKQMKIDDARDKYPEAMSFYFEDRSNWMSLINSMRI